MENPLAGVLYRWPGWLAEAPHRRQTWFDLKQPLPAGALIQAVPEADAQAGNVVPSDQYLPSSDARRACFFLKPGRYEVRLETDEGRRPLGRLSVA